MAACLLSFTALCLAFGTPATAPRAQPPAAAPAAVRELLNSERIEQKFGSYGIAVLRSDARLRVANLYSESRSAAGETERRTCRTFAVTRYPDEVAAAFAAEHREILAGGSIGAVFAAHGWRVTKAHLYYGERAAAPHVAELMRVAPGARLALDAYVLEIAKGDARFEYASIVEIHHPDYLALPDLATIYGPPNARGRERLLASLLADADAAAR
ncbi:MAG TPA: hypothetical protein VFJ95_13930 [Gammaproteobacteria bacterium]|nr:hypothetical protein [Gammaproteobacteria bacterium]